MNVLTRNLVWKLFALAAAFAVWLNVSNEPDLATIVSVPVQYNHFPKDLEISSDIEETVDLEARGPSGLLSSLHDGRIAAIIDFADVTVPGERTFTITGKELKLPRGIVMVRTIPAQLRFTFERRATRFVQVERAVFGEASAGVCGGERRSDAATTRDCGARESCDGFGAAGIGSARFDRDHRGQDGDARGLRG